MPYLRILLVCMTALAAACDPPGQEGAGGGAAGEVAATEGKRVRYPETGTVEQVDDYHGTRVADPYRWLEQDVRASAAVADWVKRQNELTFGYLSRIPGRDAIRARLTELWDYERFGVPERRGGRYFFSRNDGLQNQSVLYVQESLTAAPEVLLDPNAWSEDGTVALADAYPSPDGRFLAYMIQDAGSDWRTVRVLNVETGETLPETLEWLKFTTLAWAGDGSGFYYSRYPEPAREERFTSLNRNHTVYFHALNRPQAADREVYARPDYPDWSFVPKVSHDGRHLVIEVSVGTDERNQVVYQDLTDPNAEPFMLVAGFEAGYTFADSLGDELYFRTNAAAPRSRLVKTSPAMWESLIVGEQALAADDIHTLEDQLRIFEEVVPEQDRVLVDTSLIGKHVVAHYLDDAKSAVTVLDAAGRRVRDLELPGIGSAGGFTGDPGSPETFFSFASFDNPGEIWRYDVATGERRLFRRAAVAFDRARYVVEQVFFTSSDGTRVPMFIAHRRDLERQGGTPTLLYGYGGFNVSLTPDFSVARLAWMELGGVYAVANLRGGGEYGEEWHEAGTKQNKQNVFDDFIAAAEHLIEQGYTRPEQLGIVGGSNGGLLVGAVINQRPELFGAALPAVGVMDMLRFHRFTAGRFWTDDYGSADEPEEFPALYAYSPYHNIRDGECYPAVLATTADTDDRVVPGHSFKYMARLQQAQACDEPVLIRIETRAGHGAGKPTQMIIEEYADRWAFLVENLGLALPDGYR